MSRTKKLTAFTASYSQASVVFPYVLVAPAYFAQKIQLGGMMQTASAFSQRAGRAVVLHHHLSPTGGVAGGGQPSRRVRGGDCRGARAGNPRRQDSRRRGGRRRRDRPQGTDAATAERNAAGERRRIQFAQGRAHAGDRPVRLRQIDAVPRHCRHLAVRRGLDHRAGGRNIDDAAAAAVFPDRTAARRRSNIPPRTAPSPTARSAARSSRSACPSSRRNPTNTATGTGCSRSASSSALGSHARCCMRRNICSSTKPPLRSTNLRRRRCIACSRRNCRQPPSSRSAIARRSTPSTSAMSGSPATAIDSCCRTPVRA